MKKIIFFISLVTLIGLTMVFSANAQETTTTQEITIKDLEMENAGMLPTSPFYFLKEWRREISKFFTFNPVKKAELELDEINQRAAEIKRLEEVAPQNIEAINKAASNYQKNIERLRNRLEILKETSQNPNVDKLLDKLIDRLLKHQEIFDNLEKKFEVRQEISEQKRIELREKFEANREQINGVVSKIPERLDNIDRFRQRLEKTVESRAEGIFKELRAIETLDRIKEKLPEEQQGKIQEIKERIIERFEDRMKKLNEDDRMRILSPETMRILPGDQIRRMEILREIEGKVSPEIRRTIENVGEKILEQKIERSEIRVEEIKKMIQEVKHLIVKVEERLPSVEIELQPSIKKLLEKANTHLLNSEKALAENSIGEAFGQVISAAAIVKNALHQVQRESWFQRKSRLESPEVQKAPVEGAAGSESIKPLERVCIQVITPALSPDGACKEFPTPCDVPSGWKKVDRCPPTLPPVTPLSPLQ